MKIKVSNVNTPNWREVNVKSHVPAELEKLSEMARNIWWSWNYEARDLWRSLDRELFEKCGENPVLLLEKLPYECKEAATKNKEFMKKVKNVYKLFTDYMKVPADTTRPVLVLLLGLGVS